MAYLLTGCKVIYFGNNNIISISNVIRIKPRNIGETQLEDKRIDKDTFTNPTNSFSPTTRMDLKQGCWRNSIRG